MMADIETRPRSSSFSPPNTPPFPPVLTPPEVNDPLAFQAYFVPYGPGSWAPYQPLTSGYYSPKPPSLQTVDQFFERHALPFNLLVLNEKDKMAVTVAFEQHGILLAQAEIIQRRQRQKFAVHRIQELEMESQDVELQQQIRQAGRRLDMAIIEALQKVLISFPIDPPDTIACEHDVPLDMPDDWVNKLLAMAL